MITPDITVNRNGTDYVGFSYPDYMIFASKPWFNEEAIYVSKNNVLIPKERYDGSI